MSEPTPAPAPVPTPAATAPGNPGRPTPDEMREALKEVFDPEIPINIVDLGLIYEIKENAPGDVHVLFTLTSPTCPVSEQLAASIKGALGRLNGVTAVTTQVTHDPPWSKEKMTFDGKLQANMMGIG